MKLKSLSLILLLGSLGSFAAHADTYLVSGVNLDNITESSSFYDNGKGYYWQWDPLRRQLESKYNANNKSYSFLGEWQGYTTGAGGSFSVDQVSGLRNDANTCWYNVAVNLITYWQTAYGVFYAGSEPLKTGYAYDKSLVSDFGGTQSLQVGKLFYDNWKNEGGNLNMAASWYFHGNMSDPYLKDGAATAGYFKEYFTNSYCTDEIYFGSDHGSGNLAPSTMTMTHVTTAFGDSFGFSDDGVAEAGKIGYLGLSSSAGGHAITCYGYNTDENGIIKSLIVTNSDDRVYGTFELFLSVEDGDLYLYEDEALTKRWNYANVDWYVQRLSFIDTPDSLKDMLSQYRDADNALVWNGELATWSADYAKQTAAEEMPTADTGWDVYAQSGSTAGYYHAFYDDARAVEFGDHAGSTQNISVSGAVKSGTIKLSANTHDYTFTAASEGGSITAKNLYKRGTATVNFSGLQVVSQGYTQISGGILKLTDGATLVAPLVEIESHGTLMLDSGTVSILSPLGSVIVYDGGLLEIGTGGASISSDLNLYEGATLVFNLTGNNTNSAALTLVGNIEISGLCNFEFNESSLADNTTYTLISFKDGWSNSEQISNISLGSGTLSYSNNALYYTYVKPIELTWDTLREGAWSSDTWDGESSETTGANVTFATDASVTVNGTVAPGKITVESGKSVTLLAGDSATLTGTRVVTLSESSSLNTQLSLRGRPISLASGSTLTYDLTTANSIKDIDLSVGSSLVLAEQSGNTNTQHSIASAGALAGNITIGAGNDLTLELKESKDVSGTVTSAIGTNLTFGNSSASQAITYTLSSGTGNIAGTINVGRAADTMGTTLSTSANSAAAFNLAENGTLQLTGGSSDSPSAFTGTVGGSGTVLVDKNATVNFAVSDNKTRLSNSTTLLVQGNATIGANGNYNPSNLDGLSTGVSTSITDNIVVDGGYVDAWLDSSVSTSPLSMQNLTLSHGGQFNIKTTISQFDKQSNIIKASVGQLTIGDGGGKFGITSDFRSYASSHPNAKLEISAIKGTGDVTFYGYSVNDAKTQIISVKDTSSYIGDITVDVGVDLNSFVNYDSLHITALEFSDDTSMSGSLTFNGERISTYYMEQDGCRLQDFQYRAMLGLNADISIGGLDGNDGAYLYAGSLNAVDIGSSLIFDYSFGLAYADAAAEATKVGTAITKAEHSLTLKSNSDHNFAGTVMSGVSITKQGSGTQTFSGDVSRFSGSLNVQEGTLAFTDAVSVTNLEISSGSTLRTGGTVTVGGDVTFSAASLASIYRASSLETTDVTLSGTATVDSNLNLGSATSLTMATQVDMTEHSLTLSENAIPLHLTLDGLNIAKGTMFDLTLFTNVSSLVFGDMVYTAVDITEPKQWAAADYFVSDYLTSESYLVYDNTGMISLTGLSMVPEPSSATLSILALASLAARRRRR